MSGIAAVDQPPLQAIGKGGPTRFQDVGRGANGVPDASVVRRFNEHAHHRAGAPLFVHDAHLVVGQPDAGQARIGLDQRLSQRVVERSHRSVALGGHVLQFLADTHLNGGLGQHGVLGSAVPPSDTERRPAPVFNQHHEVDKFEQGLIVRQGTPDDQFKRGVGVLVCVALCLLFLDVSDDLAGVYQVQLAVETQFPDPSDYVAAAGQFGDDDRAGVAHGFRG